MKRLSVLCLGVVFFFGFSKTMNAQCPGCQIADTLCTGANGEICTDTIPDGIAGTSYEQNITFNFPRRFTIQQGDTIPGTGIPFPALPGFPTVVIVDVLGVTLQDIKGLPGLSWECDSSQNGCHYIPAVGTEYGCVKICGDIPCDSSGARTLEFQFEYVYDGQDFLDAFTGGIPFPFPVPTELPTPTSYTVGFNVHPSSPLVLDITLDKPNTIGLGESITFSATTGFDSYTWSTGDSTAEITVSPTQSSTYSLEVADSLGCTQSYSVDVTVIQPSGIVDNGNHIDLTVYPNPNDGTFLIDYKALGEVAELKILNAQGQQVYFKEIKANSLLQDKKLSLNSLSKGIYLLQLNTNTTSTIKKFIIE